MHAAQSLLTRLYIYENNTGLHHDLSSLPQFWERDIFQLHIDFAKRENPLLVLNSALEIIKKRKKEYDSSAKGTHYILLFQRIYSFIMYILDNFEPSGSSISTEQIESCITEYYQLYHEVHDRITSYHTMRLFYYCSMLMCFLLPANHPEISHINAAWSDTCNAMIALPFLSDTEKNA